MKPRNDLILNATGLLVISPLLGIMAAGIVLGFLEAVMWTLGSISGFIASIFFDVDFTAIVSRMPIIRQAKIWFIFGGGTFGGIIWSCLEIRERWQKHKVTGKGW